MPDQLVTIAQVKARLEITDTSDDTLLTELVEQVSDWLQAFTGRHFIPEPSATYYVDTTAGNVIEVQRGIRTVTSLSIANADQPDDGSGTYVAVAAADVILRPSSMDLAPGWPATRILLRGTTGRLVQALNGAKIVGAFGFAAVPPQVQAVTIEAVAAAFTARMAGDSDVIGPEASPVASWARLFAPGTVQRATIERYRYGPGFGIA